MTAMDLTAHYARIGADPVTDAFDARKGAVPWRSRRPLPPGDIPDAWARLLAGHRSPDRRLCYLHVPFCANHCLFCGFYRNAYEPTAASAYADLLITEIEREASEPAIADQPIEALYIGGGTPSALTAKDLARLLGTVKRALPLAADCEITLEGRIMHFDPEKIDACIEAGANRISIGVQTFDTAVRRRQGRRATKDEAIRFLSDIRARDRVALVIDLLYGLPGQTADVWSEDLQITADIAPDGVDLYGLYLFPGAPLHAAIAAGKFPAATPTRELGSMYRAGSEALAARGWGQISNSHWARTPRERNIYNRRIKEGADCLAYGSGAAGSLGRYSYAVAGDLEPYCVAVRDGRKPIDSIRVADDLQPMRNLIIGGLEVGRLDLEPIRIAHVPNVMRLLARLLEQWQAAGLVTMDGTVLLLTTAGRFWASNLITALDTILTGPAPAVEALRPGRVPPRSGRRHD